MGLDVAQPALLAHMLVYRHACRDIGGHSEPARIAVENFVTQFADGCRNVDAIAFSLQRFERVPKQLIDGKIRSRSSRAGVRRKIEENDRHLAIGAAHFSEGDEFGHPLCQH